MTTQANRQGRPWQRRDGRWAARAYPPDGGKPKMVYGKTEAEVIERQYEIEVPSAPLDAEAQAIIDGTTPEQQRIREALLPPRPPKPVRITVDLTQAEHLALRRYATEHGTSASRVIRDLLATLGG